MKSCTRLAAVSLATATLTTLAALPLAAQTDGFEPPRLAGGRPNLNGIWQVLNTANYDLEPHMARPAMQLREGPHGPLPAAEVLYMGAVGSVPGGMGVVVGGAIPYKPDALAKKKENQENWLSRDPEVKCYLPGVPRATYMPFPFQIFQNDHSVFIAYEYAGAVREIYMEDPGPAQVDSWMGQSFGKWDGDTLVVDVTGLLDQSWLDRSGNWHSDKLKVTERYSMISENHLQYSATIEDPEVFTEPWTIEMPIYRRIEPNARLMDFRCVEFVEELLYGEYRRNPLPRLVPGTP
jgi:hypothetical protein